MTRKGDKDRPLLAGRLKPYRRPPGAATGAIGLRLRTAVCVDDFPTAEAAASPSDHIAAAIHRAETIGSALHIALETYSRILSLVGQLEDTLRSSLDDDKTADDSLPAQLCDLLSMIDGVARQACDAHGPLLDGRWRGDLLDAAGRATVSITLPLICTASLGSDAVGGRLSALAVVSGQSPASAIAIVRSAVLWLAGERERIFRVLADVVEPAVAELEVIEANCASLSATDSADFAADLAGISKLHALACQSREPSGDAAANAHTLSGRVQSDRTRTAPGRLRLCHSDDA